MSNNKLQPAINTDVEYKLLQEKLVMARLLALILAASSASAIVIGVLLLLVQQYSAGLGVIILATVAVCIYSGGFFLLPKKAVGAARFRLVVYVLTLGLILMVSAAQYIVGNAGSMPASYIIVPVVAGLLGANRKDLIFVTILAFSCLAIFYSLQEIWGVYKPLLELTQYPYFVLALWIINASVIGLGVIVVTHQLSRARGDAEEKSLQLSYTIEAINNLNRDGATIAQTLRNATIEIRTNSSQQAAGATEQASSIVQATSGLEELGETANSIASNSERVLHTANQTLDIARRVEAKSETVNSLTEMGERTVLRVVEAIESLRNRIEGIAQRLLMLTERSKEIGNIIDLIRNIADETHLLSLNASIESADSKTGGSGGGRRFGVIAGEVKNLADRSLEAAEDVQKVILEVQGAIATAVLAAEEGKKDSLKVTNEVYETRKVISELGAATEEAVQSASQIVSAVNQVATLAEEITLATGQQSSASDQVIMTMRVVGTVSRQSASAITQTSTAIAQIDEQVARLTDLLRAATNLQVNSVG